LQWNSSRKKILNRVEGAERKNVQATKLDRGGKEIVGLRDRFLE
jgi:hypothetical protein